MFPWGRIKQLREGDPNRPRWCGRFVLDSWGWALKTSSAQPGCSVLAGPTKLKPQLVITGITMASIDTPTSLSCPGPQAISSGVLRGSQASWDILSGLPRTSWITSTGSMWRGSDSTPSSSWMTGLFTPVCFFLNSFISLNKNPRTRSKVNAGHGWCHICLCPSFIYSLCAIKNEKLKVAMLIPNEVLAECRNLWDDFYST